VKNATKDKKQKFEIEEKLEEVIHNLNLRVKKGRYF